MSANVHTRAFIPARLAEGRKEWYLDFYFELPDGTMKRCVKRLNAVMKRLKTTREKRAFGEHECQRINEQLAKGWTPLEEDAQKKHGRGATPWRDVFDKYAEWLKGQEISDNLDHSAALTYLSDLTILTQWAAGVSIKDIKQKGKRQPISNNGTSWVETIAPNMTNGKFKYIYELDRERVTMFLTWAIEERGVSSITRDNYKRWLRGFCNWCIEHGYLESNPVSKIVLVKTAKEKAREARNKKSRYINQNTRIRIFDYFEKNNKQMLLACYLSYYCMIRPHEMMQLTLDLFHIEDRLIFIPHYISKNHKDQWITLPDVVLNLMTELGVFNYPKHYLLFDNQLQPSGTAKPNRGDRLSDYWKVMRSDLGLPRTIQFYDTKRTGITDMGKEIDLHQVQLQARHSSITMTERYVQETPPEANLKIQKYR